MKRTRYESNGWNLKLKGEAAALDEEMQARRRWWVNVDFEPDVDPKYPKMAFGHYKFIIYVHL